MEDSAGVFRNVEGCLIREDLTTEDAEERRGEAAYVRHCVIGCDVAKHTDWTVLIAMDAETGRCFAMERFNQLDWPIQKERIVAFARRHRGRVILDATGIGDPIFDDLKRVIPDIEGFKLTAGSKVELVQRLIVAVEQRKISWPGTAGRVIGDQLSVIGGEKKDHGLHGWHGSDWDILTNEMKRYEYQIFGGGWDFLWGAVGVS